MALNATIFIPAPSSSSSSISIAFGPQRSRVSLKPSLALPLEARLGSRGGGSGLLEHPGFDQSQTYQEPGVEEGGEMGKLRQRLRFGGGDRYRVLLLDHQRHTEPQVASVLQKLVLSVTPNKAHKCFHESRENEFSPPKLPKLATKFMLTLAAVLPKVVPSVTPDEARKCFHESRENGVGVVTVTVKEHAEFYAQMMARCGLRSSIEPDRDTI